MLDQLLSNYGIFIKIKEIKNDFLISVLKTLKKYRRNMKIYTTNIKEIVIQG